MEQYCRKCKKLEKVIGFEIDNPILECNHIRERLPSHDWIIHVGHLIENMVSNEAKARGISIESARNILSKKLIDKYDGKDTI